MACFYISTECFTLTFKYFKIKNMQPDNNGGYPPQQQVPPNYPAPISNSQMKKHHAWGLIISLIVSLLLLLGAAGFAIWAYGGREDYKNNADKKINAAVEIAKQQKSDEKDKEFVEKEKNPFKVYKGPSTFASVNVTYPKTWAAFVTETDKSSNPVDGFFHPNFVPGVQSGTAFALRIQVVNQPYNQQLKEYESKTKAGKVRVSPYKAPKVPDVLGTRVEGEINTGQKDFMVLFPVRDKTLKVWTESESFLKDFNEIILPNLTFVP